MPNNIRIVGNCDYEPNGDGFKCSRCSHESKRLKKRNCPAKYNPDVDTEQGVGTELKGILSSFGIYSKQNCGCENLRVALNAMGPDECERNIDQIANRLVCQAKRRGWLMSGATITKWIARGLVSLAVIKARKKARNG